MKDRLDEMKMSCDELIVDAYDKGIRNGLTTKWLGHELICYPTISSTQSEAHNLAKKGSSHGTVIVAGEQIEGRGRLGRTWHSEKNKGVWISMILQPLFSYKEAAHVTLITSVVVNNVLKKMYGIKSQTKWPNDIYIDGKKCAGILCELQGDQEKIHYLVVGVGINTHKTKYPDDIQNKATSIEENINISPKRLEIIAQFLNEFEIAYDYYSTNGFKYFFNQYNELMYGKNKKIIINNKILGNIIGIDEEGHLLVEEDNNNILKISSGEIKFIS